MLDRDFRRQIPSAHDGAERAQAVADDGAKGNDGDALQVSEYRLFVSARLVPLTFAPAIAIVVI